MADEYITKQAINDAIRDAVRKYPNTFYNGLEVARQIAHDLPAADVAPVRHGEWFVSIGKDGKPAGTICPICGFAWSEAIDAVKLEPCLSLIETPYCPNCGAIMYADRAMEVFFDETEDEEND